MSSLLKRLRRRGPGLITQLFLFFVLPLVALLLIVALVSQAWHQDEMRTLVGERDARATRLAAQALDEQLRRRALLIRSVAQYAAQTSPAEALAAYDFLRADFDGGWAFFNAAGEPVTPPGALAELATPPVTDFIKGVASEPVFSSSILNPRTGTHWELVAVAVHADLKLVGAFSPEALARATLNDVFNPDTGMVVYVVDQNRHALYQSGACTDTTPCTEHPGVAEVFQGTSGLTYAGEHVVAYSPVPAAGWALVIEEPWHTVDTPGLRATQYTPLLLLAPALVLALAVLWFGVRQIVQPLQALEAKAANLAWGRYESIAQPVGGITEIRRLQTELVHLAQKVNAAQQSLHSYIGAITAGQEEERRRLARELHDDTLQALIALNQRLQLASLTPMEASTAATLSELQRLAEQTITDLRRFTRALRPIYLEDLGLAAALEALTREMSPPDGVKIVFRQIGPERRLTSAVELALYRLAQEALSNVLRHAQAAHATLTLSFNPENVTLAVSDDGRGFSVPDSPAEFAPGGHFGLLGMHERAELIGAQLDIRSQSGQGTQVMVTLLQ